ncbi:histidine kinase [Ferruginibacter sp. SUN106]|uniref:histidine kinase n=1 Tax=Ferruginibacter sp. SUN106 TaxID=2978348 RepID=UPI003D368B5D
MQRILLLMACFILSSSISAAQDTIKINGQPKWEKAMDIADHCLFYEETLNKAFSFEEVKKQAFVPYRKELRKQKFSNRPLIIQWLKFTIQNTSQLDTVNLSIYTVHYFTSLYNNTDLLGRSGAYEEIDETEKKANSSAFDRGRLPVIIPPNTTVNYWFRTEDRQNQLIPPQILLETKFISMAGDIESGFSSRYLFLIMAAMVGCFIFIGIYAAYHFYLYRDKAFAWYIAYAVAAFFSGLHWMDIRLGMKMFSPLVHDIIFSVFVYIIPVLYSFFIGRMLQLDVHFKKGWLLVKLLVSICVIQLVLEFTEVRFGWFPFNPDYYGIVLIPVPILLLNIVLLILAAKSKDKVKWFLFTGILSLVILWCMPLFNIYAPSEKMKPELFLIINFPIVFLLLGLTIEAICFSFALTYRSKLVLEEKNALQKNYNLQLETALQQRTNELQQQSQVLEDQKIKQIQTEFAQKIAETEMVALRAQMNPHFIFNCLNSIKLYTLENDSQTASEYLTKFSQLIRLVLENSRSEKISLQKELETLKLYIELEAMRFKDKVKYQINVVPHIDQQYIELPPLLLQPYVENAIWHGLMHKPEGGNICIDISQPEEYLLHIEITDDGIGRDKASEHKSKSATRQKSFGLKMTSERLDAINHIYQTKTEVQIIDLKDETGNSAGTKVIIQIPL